MLQLRPYQQETIEQLRNGFAAGHQRQVLCLPTGAGKTVVFSEMVRLASERNTSTLVLTDRIELFEQTFKALSRANVNPQLISANSKIFSSDAIINVGMVETVARRLQPKEGGLLSVPSLMESLSPALIIIDEAHKGNFNKIIEAFPQARVIGATATPVGKHFYKFYTNIIQNVDIPELIEQGFLSPCRAFQMQDDMSDLAVSGNDYSDGSLFSHFNKRKLYSGVIEQYLLKTPGQKAIVFNVNIEHSEQMTSAFNAAGIMSECITSKTPKDKRKAILDAFKAGHFPVLNNCGILTTGYDEASIETVIVNRATKSLSLWLQMCGRGSRIYRNKPYFTVLDFGMNHNEHGLWDEPRTWAIEPPRKKKPVLQEAPIKICEECSAVVAAQAKKCNYCGYQFPVKEVEQKQGVMVEVSKPSNLPEHLRGRCISALNVEELADLQKSKQYKATYVWRVVRSKGEDAVKEYAEKMNYKPEWVSRQTEEMADVERNTYTNYVLK